MRILGIDPGTSRVGFGVIDNNKGLSVVHFGTIESKHKTYNDKITEVLAGLKVLLAETKPDLAAIEKLYFAKNQKTALSVAQARGAILSLLLERNISVVEFSPTEVKSQVTGYGLADKKGVAKMVKAILKLEELPGHDDASDALAIAIAAANNARFLDLV